MRDYLEACLAEVPQSDYRRRLREELEAHLTDLGESLLAGGYGEEEAARRAMELLGKPEALREQYREAWERQPERRRRDLRDLFSGCVLAGFGCFLALGLLKALGFTYDQAYPGRRVFPILGDPRWKLVFGLALFLGETLPNLAWLLLRFRRRSLRRAWVTAGLLLAWGVEKGAILLLSAGIYGMSPLQLPRLLARIAAGGDPTAPWLTPLYLLGTLAATVLIGLAAGG
jgi:hypothetical protein